MQTANKHIPLIVAATPLGILITLLTINVLIYGDDAISGSSQVILMLCAFITAGFARGYGVLWSTIEKGVIESLSVATPAILILLLVGALSGAWMISGIVPTMIYYGLQVLDPTFFLVSACVISAVVAIFTGSSWTTSATIGIALIGIGNVLGISPAWSAGAILSGAYFGDKMSPLSDTTNLAAASAGTELFTHIRYMLITTTPSIIIALALFALLGFTALPDTAMPDVAEIEETLQQTINITPWLLVVPLAVLAMIINKVPALPALFVGAALGAVFALIFQPDLVRGLAPDAEPDMQMYRGIMQALYTDSAIVTGHEVLDQLLRSGGIAGMLGTIWLIISAMMFGGAMEASGFLSRITEALVSRTKSVFGLVATTAGTCIVANTTTSDQYLALLIPGRMFAKTYRQRGLAPQNLSRTLEDSGTATSVLVPWNTCGAYHAAVLGVATLSYAPFAFFCLLSPVMTLLIAAFKYKIAPLGGAQPSDQNAQARD